MTDSGLTSRRLAAACWIQALATFAVYRTTVRFEAINFDDPTYVLNNSALHQGLTWKGLSYAFTSFDCGNWHPLTWISYMIDVTLFGADPAGYHLTNAILHAVNSGLLLAVLARLTRNLCASAFVSIVFAFHPLHVESVAWISERKDVLVATFFILTIEAYRQYVAVMKPVRLAVTSLTFAVALLAKPMAVTLPIVLLLLDYWPLCRIKSRDSWRCLIAEKIPLFALSLGSGLITIYAQELGNAVESLQVRSISARLINSVHSYFAYLEQSIIPVGLIPLYRHQDFQAFDAKIEVSLICLTVITAIAITNRRRRPWIIVGWGWYLVTLLPVIGLMQVGQQSRADRYTYLPLIGPSIAVAWTVGQWAITKRRRMLSWVAIGAISGALVFGCTQQLSRWRSSRSLWQHAIACDPEVSTSQMLYGGGLFDEGRLRESLPPLEEAVRLQPGSREAHEALAWALILDQQFDKAGIVLSRFLPVDTDSAERQFQFAQGALAAGNSRRAALHLGLVIAIQPDHQTAIRMLADLEIALGQPGASQHLRRDLVNDRDRASQP